MIRHVREVPVERPPALVHRDWLEAFPWLVQGTTVRGPGEVPFDLGLFSGGSPREEVGRRWTDLVQALDMGMAVHAPQPHGTAVGVWSHEVDDGPLALVEPRDGHLTAEPGVLLTVTTADCVPVFVADPVAKAVGMIHAGWRGAAAGIVEEGLAAMDASFGTRPGDVHLHLGPAICGDCYEVGPEVFEAFGLEVPAEPAPVDVRGILAERAEAAGVEPERLTVSDHCTRCTGSGLFSHRRGDACRQVGYLGIRP